MDELNDRFKKSAENFSLIPSDGIWKNVETEIRRRERKRRFIIIFLTGAAILIGGLFLFINFSDKHPELQKNNPAGSVQNAAQENISVKKDYPEKENAAIPQVSAEIKNPVNSKTVPQIKHQATFISVTEDNNVSEPLNPKPSGQNNSIINNPTTSQIISDEITTSSAASISIKTDSIVANAKDTLETKAVKDSALAAKSDTIIPDTLIALKDTTQTPAQKSKWSIVIGIAPTLSFSEQQEDGDYQIISNYRDSSDNTLLTWNYRFAVSYRFIPRMEVFTGIGVINFSEEILSKQAVYRYDTNTIIVGPSPTIIVSRGYFNINGDSTGTARNKFSWLEIPIGVCYDFFPDHKLNISLQPEASFNKLMSADGYIYNYETLIYEKIKVSDLKSWQVSYGIGISFQYAILKNLHFEFTPFYKNFQNSIYDDPYPLKQHLQQTELRLSLRYIIK